MNALLIRSHHFYLTVTTESSLIFYSNPLSLFLFSTDTFKLTYLPSKTSKTPVQLSNKDITWRSDRETKYKNPKIPSGKTLRDVFAGYARPFNWQRDIWDLSLTNDTSDEGFANQDFIVWMRVAAFPTFRKLYRRIVHTGTFKDGLPKGKYQIDIHYSILSV